MLINFKVYLKKPEKNKILPRNSLKDTLFSNVMLIQFFLFQILLQMIEKFSFIRI